MRASLPELQGKTLVCHCREDQLCHGDVLAKCLAERLDKRSVDSYLEQLAQASSAELFAGTAILTECQRELGIRTLPPHEQSEADRKENQNTEYDLSDGRVIQQLLQQVWARDFFI